MPCQPIDDTNISLPPTPPGFIGSFAPQIPSLDPTFPAIPLEDLFDLFNTLSQILPSGTLKPQLSAGVSKNPIDAILSLLSQFMPFLMMYTFFLPVLNLILCIIEFLCAINNPFKMVKALIRLFRNCIPEFLALFPYFAIPIMILSLLLLIIALIIYLIQRVISFIQMIIKNIQILAKAAKTLDNDGILAITKKLGNLLCSFQNLFVLLGVILLIIQIIKAVLKLSFKIPPCDDSDGSDSGCCTPDVCPSFIKNNKTIISSTGNLQYFNEVAIDSGLTLPAGFGGISSALRNESWQFYDPNLSEAMAFNNITHAFDLPAGVSKVFFPSGIVYDSSTDYSQVPYTIDLKFMYDPISFGRSDSKGKRFIKINNCIITKAPSDGVVSYDNSIIAPYNGTLLLAGGLAFEEDNVTPILLNGNQANLNTLIKLDTISSLIPPPLSQHKGINFENVEYTFKINHEVLIVPYSLITIGCHPDVSFNKNFINATIGALHNINAAALTDIANASAGAGGLPDVDAAQSCVLNAISSFRQNVSVESANNLQQTVNDCLNKLKNDSSSAIVAIIKAAFSPYNSSFELSPPIQFTTSPIQVLVTLSEAGSNNMGTGLPADAGASLAQEITADITFGSISSFSYDGYSKFVADITSSLSGNGEISVAFQNKKISTLDNPSDNSIAPSVTVKTFQYTFVESIAIDGQQFRNETDVSLSNAEGA